jgi:hypothetical protein
MGEKVSKERVRRRRECVLRSGNNPVNTNSEKLLVQKSKKRKERGGWRQTITVLWDRECVLQKPQVIVVLSVVESNM